MRIILKGIEFLKSKINRSILFNYLKASIVLLIILCIVTSVIYGIMNRSLREEVVKVNDILLQNTINSLETEFVNLYGLVSLINSNPRINGYMNMQHNTLSPYKEYEAYEIVNDLKAYVNGNDFIDSIYILFDNDIIISNTHKVNNSFYFKYLGEELNEIVNLPKAYRYKESFYLTKPGNDTGMFYVNSLPIGNKRTPKATVAIQIDSNAIKDFVLSNQVGDKTETSILDLQGNLLAKYNTHTEEYREKDLVTNSLKSDIVQLQLVSVTPRAEFESELKVLQSTIIYIMLISLGIGITFAVYFSFKNYYTVATLMEVISQEEMINANENIFEHIEYKIARIIDENENLNLKIDKQTRLISNHAIEKLFRQEISKKDEVNEIMEMLDIKFDLSTFLVCSIKLDITNDSGINYPKIIDQIETLINENQNGYVFYMNEHNISLLVEIIHPEVFNPIMMGKTIIGLLDQEYIIAAIGIGSYCYEIEDIGRSYREALLALNVTSSVHSGSVVAYESIKNLSSSETKYYYPMEVEQEIVNSVKTGNILKVKELLEKIYNENFKEIQLSGQISKILVSNMISTVIKIMNELKIDLTKFEETNILAQLYNVERVNDAYSYLIETYKIICNLVNQNKKSHNRALYEDIEGYLIENFNDQQITLSSVANKFNLSGSYLSRFFKEQSGVNFNDYVQQLRVEEAKRLLMRGDNILIKELAILVGYSNTGGLIRAFNKYEGTTSGEYRNRYL